MKKYTTNCVNSSTTALKPLPVTDSFHDRDLKFAGESSGNRCDNGRSFKNVISAGKRQVGCYDVEKTWVSDSEK
jgi:hypothetical protein